MIIVEAILIPTVIGAITGLASHLMTNEYIAERPQKEETGFYFGFIAHMLIGALASLAAVNVIIPDVDNFRTIVGISILAAMSGEALLLRNALQNEREKRVTLKNVTQMKNEEIE